MEGKVQETEGGLGLSLSHESKIQIRPGWKKMGIVFSGFVSKYHPDSLIIIHLFSNTQHIGELLPNREKNKMNQVHKMMLFTSLKSNSLFS